MSYCIRVALPALVLLSLIVSCRKEKSLEEKPAVCGYAPYIVGSTFNFMRTSQTDTAYYTLTVTGDTTLQGNDFHILSDGYNIQYIRCDNGDYTLFEPGFTSATAVHEDAVRPFLYDHYDLNYTWEDSVNATTFEGGREQSLLGYEIVEKGDIKTVLGKNYYAVVGVRQDGYIVIGGLTFKLSTIGTYYYANGAGLIEKDTPTDTTRLISYQLGQ